MANTKTDERTATATDRSSRTPNAGAANVTEPTIARRAYALYLARGGKHGHDVEDWLQAERDLQRDPEC